MTYLAWLPVLVSTVWIIAGLVSVVAITRRRVRSPENLPPVSILKPLCGSDPGLHDNLESFFAQDHPSFELLFGVTDPLDPAIEVARELAARYPRVRCRIVVHEGVGALNPKIDNLFGLFPAAAHDLVLVSDSNVRAPKAYVRELAALYVRERPGLVTNLFAGTGEDSLGAALENVQLCGFCAAGVALPTLLGDALLVGKSALFSRRMLERLGGLKRLSDVLAEDFVMGKTFAHAGERVVVAPTVLENVTRTMTLRSMVARQLRWSMLRLRLRPVPAALEPIVSPLVLLPVAWLVLGPWAILWTAALLTIRDVGGWVTLRGPRRWYVPFALAPLRELCILVAWAIALFKRHVSWRGKRFRLGAGTLLYLEPQRAGAHASR
jgi:ceramide glucosyltransferase